MHPIIALCAVALLLAGCSTPGPARAPSSLDAAATNGIEEIARAAVAEDGIVGLAVAVAIDSHPVYQAGFGHADTERSIPVTEHTVFDIASTGKHFTAAAIMLLAERGQLSLDQRVREFVPELPAHFPDATIDQLLRRTDE